MIEQVDRNSVKNAINEHINGKKQCCVIDVREDHELESIPKIHKMVTHIPKGTIPEAFSCDKETFKKKYGTEKPEKDEPMYLYCAGGVRSQAVCDVLDKMGYQNLHNMKGGVKTWVHENMKF